MITKHLTSITARFNPFRNPAGKTCRVFLAALPADARQSMKIAVTMLPRDSGDASFLGVVFRDGKEMTLDTEKMGIKDVMEEMDRHSRVLDRKAELAGS